MKMAVLVRVMIAHCLLIILTSGGTTHMAQQAGEIASPGNGAVSKRALTNFREMTQCATGRSAWDFVSYGCWCGVSGGGTPVDGIDRCCKKHDKCYDAIIDKSICGFFSSTAVYSTTYKISQKCTTCAPMSEYEDRKECRNALCQCDTEAVKCFLGEQFHAEYMNYDNKKCKGSSWFHQLIGGYFRRNIQQPS